MDAWSYGDLEVRYRRGDTEAWRQRGLEARCRCSDMEARRHGGMEVWRLSVGVATWRGMNSGAP